MELSAQPGYVEMDAQTQNACECIKQIIVDQSKRSAMTLMNTYAAMNTYAKN